ncbi:hypothetical protein [Streptomyces sp. NPDC017524]|uniref:hypothetical protein n=1 Tax=Streptomyces sp. NPDC017524 TaxID=3364999 RepID=UPI00378C2B02
MTTGEMAVHITGSAHGDLLGLPDGIPVAMREAIWRLAHEPGHPALDCKPFAGMGSVFICRLTADYRALFVVLSPDQTVIICVEHRRNYERLSTIARHWVDELRLEGVAVPTVRQPVAPVPVRSRFAARVTTVASWLAGSRRPHLHGEWASMLAGDAELGVALTRGQQRMLVIGFVFAAIRLRARDGARPLWWPVDWLLRAPSRTNAFITVAVGAQAIYIVGDGGLAALATDVWEPCGIAGASLFVLTRWLRRVRGIELVATGRAEE